MTSHRSLPYLSIPASKILRPTATQGMHSKKQRPSAHSPRARSCLWILFLLASNLLHVEATVLDDGADGGLFDSIPPILLFSNPSTGATAVATNVPLVFTFSTPMVASQKITWSANVVPANVNYLWAPDGKTLTAQYSGGWPANAAITWTLDPATFKSASGTALFDFNNTGSFTTGAGGGGGPGGGGPGSKPDPCAPTNAPSDGGSISLAKHIGYVQSSANPPIPDPELAAFFSASVASPTNNPVTEATLKFPNGTTRVLTNNPFIPRFFQFFAQFGSQAELDAAVPNGAYAITIKRKDGSTGTASLNLPDGTSVPAPQISNFPQTQGFDPAADFILRWLAYTGANAANDGIFLSLSDETGASFFAPDFCVPRDLKVTDTSILIPPTTFSVGKIVSGNLTFSRNGTHDTNSIPGIAAFSSFSKTTSFEGRTAGGAQTPELKFGNFLNTATGFQMTIAGPVNSAVRIEASADLQTWTPIFSANLTLGSIVFSDAQSLGLPYRFYRATTVASVNKP
jgi:hypothetical protein